MLIRFKCVFGSFLRFSCAVVLFFLVEASRGQEADVGVSNNAGLASPSSQQPSNSVEAHFLEVIKKLQTQLQDASLDPTTRQRVMSDIKYYEARLSEQRTAWQIHLKAAQAIDDEFAKKRQAVQPIDVRKYREEANRLLVEQQKQRELNTDLWKRVHEARGKKDPALIAKTERELAAFLTQQIEQIEKKKYPTNLTLAEVLKQYEKYDPTRGTTRWFSKRHVIVAVLAGTLVLPLVVWLRRLRHSQRSV